MQVLTTSVDSVLSRSSRSLCDEEVFTSITLLLDIILLPPQHPVVTHSDLMSHQSQFLRFPPMEVPWMSEEGALDRKGVFVTDKTD